MGDRTRLRQIALNLISNAVKFTEKGDVTFLVECDDQQVTVSVSDMGIGIPPSEQELIFEEFHRSERSVQGGYGGLGLGLAVCKQLVHLHDGTIGVQSPLKDGTGSRFYFTLPVISNLASTPDLEPAAKSPAQTVVLLAEQSETNDWLESYLRERGFDIQVMQIDQGFDQFATFFQPQPAAVVMGYSLAARQGWEIISLLRRQATTENIPVLVYTLDKERNQGELLELNYMLKPLQPEQLTNELSRHGLGSQRTVLIVDDNPEILAVHTRIVEHAGYRAMQAHNGQQALDLLAKSRPDLILLDLLMPEMDGFQMLETMRTQEELRNIPVIVITGQVLTDTDIERLNRSVATILSKGIFSADETLARIEAVLDRQGRLGNTPQRQVRKALAYIHAHFVEPISREDIARHICVSPDYLTDCFRQEMGVTPMIYLTRYRVQQAQVLLDTTDASITQVAFDAGFSDVSHFSRTFKREVGVSPHAYRRGQKPVPADKK